MSLAQACQGEAPRPPSKARRAIEGMFARIAPWYDFLNHALTLGIDRRWRRRTARAIAARTAPGSRVLDVACGTGDLMREILRTDRRAVGVDFCLPMLARARAKGIAGLLQGDALALPVVSGTFDAATIAFGVRNFQDPVAGLREIRRSLRDGGTLAVLELGIPTAPGLRQIYLAYFRLLLPLLGHIVSRDPAAYRYLSDSVIAFPQGSAFVALLAQADLEPLSAEPLSLGIVSLYLARRAVRE